MAMNQTMQRSIRIIQCVTVILASLNGKLPPIHDNFIKGVNRSYENTNTI